MVVALAWTFLVVVLAIAACVVAFPEQRARPLPHRRLLPLPLLMTAATVVLFYVPPSNDLGDPAVWMAALLSGVAAWPAAPGSGSRSITGSGCCCCGARPRGSGSRSP